MRHLMPHWPTQGRYHTGEIRRSLPIPEPSITAPPRRLCAHTPDTCGGATFVPAKVLLFQKYSIFPSVLVVHAGAVMPLDVIYLQ